jgi:hypothetical protein
MRRPLRRPLASRVAERFARPADPTIAHSRLSSAPGDSGGRFCTSIAARHPDDSPLLHPQSDLLGNVSGEGEDDAHCLVPAIGGGIEHAWAAAVDHSDAALPAVVGGRLGDATAGEASLRQRRLGRLPPSARRVHDRRRPRRAHQRRVQHRRRPTHRGKAGFLQACLRPRAHHGDPPMPRRDRRPLLGPERISRPASDRPAHAPPTRRSSAMRRSPSRPASSAKIRVRVSRAGRRLLHGARPLRGKDTNAARNGAGQSKTTAAAVTIRPLPLVTAACSRCSRHRLCCMARRERQHEHIDQVAETEQRCRAVESV